MDELGFHSSDVTADYAVEWNDQQVGTTTTTDTQTGTEAGWGAAAAEQQQPSLVVTGAGITAAAVLHTRRGRGRCDPFPRWLADICCCLPACLMVCCCGGVQVQFWVNHQVIRTLWLPRPLKPM